MGCTAADRAKRTNIRAADELPNLSWIIQYGPPMDVVTTSEPKMHRPSDSHSAIRLVARCRNAQGTGGFRGAMQALAA
jgi:hypothetical protein